MPSPWHDTVNELFKDYDDFAADFLRLADVNVGTGARTWLGQNVLSTRLSKELVADTVILTGKPWDVTHAIAVEAQREPSEDKRRKLAMYAAALWLEHQCPVDVVVLCPDEKTANWYSVPIPTGMNGCAFQPRALHPSRVPVIRDSGKMADSPPMAVLSVAFHGHDPAVAAAFVQAMGTLADERGVQYYEYGYNMSPKQTCEILEALVTTTHWPVYSPFAKLHYGKGRDEGLAEGLAEGEALGEARGEQQALFEVLSARGLHATEEERERITRCTDPAQLMAWLRKSLTISAVRELFD
jgi:hypothetical protein